MTDEMQTPGTAPESPPEQTETIKMSFGTRFLSLIIAPGELMQNIKAHPIVLAPFIVSAILGLLLVWPAAWVNDAYMQEMSNISIERYGFDFFDMSALADEYGDAPIQDALSAATIILQITGAFISPLFMSLVFAVGFFIVVKIMRSKATFGQMFSFSMHLYVLYALGALVINGLMMATGSLLDVTSLAAVFARTGTYDQLSFNLLSAIGIFPIWLAVLSFIGMKIINDFCNVKAGIIAGLYFLIGVAAHVTIYMFTWWMYDIAISMGLLEL
ncbi:MAG: YIP1 family protein [Defluviitaleaceae bacterium]|nr:YIP1 family protein [Defluviitaleaceae bacterium]